jgi:putative ABC transport system permease protein
MNFLWETFRLGLANLRLHKLRSMLTALGIVIGVSAVIIVMAVGEGNKRKALADIAQLGARNIIVRSQKPDERAQSGSAQTNRMLAYGMTRKDIRRIESTVPFIERMVPMKRVANSVIRGQYKAPCAVFGTTPDLIEVTSMRVARGRYLTDDDSRVSRQVVVIGSEVARNLFPLDDPIGGKVRVTQAGNLQVFEVIGVLQSVGEGAGTGTAQVGRNLNQDVHLPLGTAETLFGDQIIEQKSGSMEATRVEMSELIVEVETEDKVIAVAEQMKLLLDADHQEKGDVVMTVPLELLEQAKRTEAMFNSMLVAIASISLLVGGIGIMNIMLASVTERTREIGIRRALGAARRHIVMQFLVETTVLSGIGGLIGVAIGVGGSLLVGYAGNLIPNSATPAVTMPSIIVSFFVAATVGVVFGLYPAVKASQQDPIVALRHD